MFIKRRRQRCRALALASAGVFVFAQKMRSAVEDIEESLTIGASSYDNRQLLVGSHVVILPSRVDLLRME